MGLPSTIGHIDLKAVFSAIRRDGAVADDTRASIRNRCVLPILQKLDDCSQGIAIVPPAQSQAVQDDGSARTLTAAQQDLENQREERIKALRQERRRTGRTLFPELDWGPVRPPLDDE